MTTPRDYDALGRAVVGALILPDDSVLTNTVNADDDC